jgi:periplasmic divalent cation tolerance protein
VVQQDDALLKRFEDFLKEAFFLNKPLKVALHIRWLQPIHAPYELVEEAGLHMLAGMEITVVLCTFPTLEVARQIGTLLVETQHAACVNLVPSIESIYRWEGKVESGKEVLALFKTTSLGYAALEARLKELHPYAVPEIIALPVHQAFRPYAEWVAGSISESPSGSSPGAGM